MKSFKPANMIGTFFLVLCILTSVFGEEEARIECPEDGIALGDSNYYFDHVPNVAKWEDCGRICALTTKLPILGLVRGWNNLHIPWMLPLRNCCWHKLYNPEFVSGERGCPEDPQCKGDF